MSSNPGSAAGEQWRKEASCFIPEAVLDQMMEMNGNNLQKLILYSWKWLQKCTDEAYAHLCQNTGDGDILGHLCNSLKISPAYLADVRQRNSEAKQQIVEVVNYYLTQKLDCLKVETTDENPWKREASIFIPDRVLDQMLELSGNDIRKMLINALQWIQDWKDMAYNQVSRNSGEQDIIVYLSDSLNIPPTYLDGVKLRSTDQKQQVLEALHYYLTQKLDLLLDHGSDNNLRGMQVSKQRCDNAVSRGSLNSPHLFNKKGQTCEKRLASTQIAHTTTQRSEIAAPVRMQKAVKKYKLPRPAFQQTEAYHEVLRRLAAKHNVVHIYGMSGNGKSQIVRAVCDEIGKRVDTVIWHVQCADGVSLVSELKEMLSKLTSIAEPEEIICSMEKAECNKLMSALGGVDIPVLIALEDVNLSERQKVQSMIQELFYQNRDVSNLVQFLIATQKKDAIFSEDDLMAMEGYQIIKISGFTKAEAEKFLSSGVCAHEPGKDKIPELAEILHYSPLRLTLAKAYCKKYRTTYQRYYESLGKNQKIIDKEKELLDLDHSIAKYHGYEVIIKALEPKNQDESESEENLHFKVIQMMSFISNEDIPDVLLGRFFHSLKTLEVREEADQVRYLVTRLESECDMTIHELGKQVVYGAGLSSMHMDILHAIHLNMYLSERKATAVKVLHALIPLVKKDNRYHTDSNFLFRLMKHIERVITLASQLLKAEFNLKKPVREDFEIQICLSWLYEVLGFVNTEYATAQDILFEKALLWLWEIACSYTGLTLLRPSGGGAKKGLLNYEHGKDPNHTAEKAYRRIKSASEKIPEAFVKQHYATFATVDSAKLGDMKEALVVNPRIDWEEMQRQVEERRYLTEKQTNILQECKMLLTVKKLRKVALAERIASVLHSRGRQGLKKTDSPDNEQYLWYANVGLKLTQMMSKDTGIKTTFEYIIAANNILPHMLEDPQNETDDKFVGRLKEVKGMAEGLKQANGYFYEHGIYKPMSGTPYSVLNAMKYIVRANTRYYKRPHLVHRNDNAEAVKQCDEFFQLAKDTAAMFVVASCCMIFAAKYYAASGKLDEALDACEAGFDHGINSMVETRPRLYAWAVHNIGRVIYKYGRETPDGAKHTQRYRWRCDRLLHADISPEMRSKLNECRIKLNGIEFFQPSGAT